MADVTWRIGAFASQLPAEARDIGRAYALEDEAAEQLYETAGQVRPGAIVDACYGGTLYGPGGMPEGCCAASPCQDGGADTACARGTCCCEDEEAFDAIYPEVRAVVSGARALSAAVRDILTDPDLADVPGAIEAARALAAAGQLAALYAPAVPAKKLPDGTDAPARCPVCGACVCPDCGDACCCVVDAPPAPPAPAE